MCPVVDCGDRTIYNWIHHNCGMPTELNSDGMLRCSYSSHHHTNSSIFDWLFQCKARSNDFSPCDKNKLLTILALTLEYQTAANKDWTDLLIDNLSEERARRRKSGAS